MLQTVAGFRGLGSLGIVTLVLAVATSATVGIAVSQGPRTVTIKEIQDRNAYMDPAEGREFDLGSHKGKPIIIALMGDCLGCSIHKADFNDLRQTGGFKVVGLYTEGAKLENVTRDFPWMKIAVDETGLHDRLNAYFLPRVYAFDSRGRLIALQGPEEDLERFVNRVGTKL